MKTLEMAVLILAAATLALWRGIALYKITFKKKNL